MPDLDQLNKGIYQGNNFAFHNPLTVEFPQGAGGNFLASVLGCCIYNLDWKSTKDNFHRFPWKLKHSHESVYSKHHICIDSQQARYNFWIYYFRKTVLRELPWYRYQNQRRVKCLYNDLSANDDGFWLLNQCVFIQKFNCDRNFQIDWIQMLQDPPVVWQSICDFLESNNQKNYWSLDQWMIAIENYKSTLASVKVNPNHISWKIWAAAFLIQQGIHPSWHLIANFNTVKFNQWLAQYGKDILDYTHKSTYYVG